MQQYAVIIFFSLEKAMQRINNYADNNAYDEELQPYIISINKIDYAKDGIE
jgi:hypothetical protein